MSHATRTQTKKQQSSSKKVSAKKKDTKQVLSGARIVIESLKKEGVEVIFGYPGGSIIPVFDELYGEKSMRLIMPRHEQAGGHSAEGYAKTTGKTGVVITTGGPGATNLTTVLADAHMDSVPLVAISGQVKTHLIGTDAFQEADMTGISYGITKHNYLIKDVRDIAKTIKEAFYIASTGRPGPVHISIPVDLQKQETSFEYPQEVKMRNYSPTYKGHASQINRACELIANSKRPMILVGGGALYAGAEHEVNEFITKTQIPTTSTLMGLGVVPTNRTQYVGMIGMHGTVTSNKSMGEADLIINIGARFDDRVTGNTKTFAQNAMVIHIDIDPSSIGKTVFAHLPVVGDAKSVLQELLPKVKRPKIDAWKKKLQEMKRKHPIYYRDFEGSIGASALFNEINRATKNIKTIYTAEVGQHQMWAAQMLELDRPRQLLNSGGLGTMGFGFPAAIGAQIADPDAVVVSLAGDGSFQMNLQELALLHTYKLPVKVIVINNGFLGMVRQWQEMFHSKRYSSTCMIHDTECPPSCSGQSSDHEYFPDFVKLAGAYGIDGYRARTKEELRKVLKTAFTEKKNDPVLIEVWVPKEENVMPMVPPGGSLSDVIEHDPKTQYGI